MEYAAKAQGLELVVVTDTSPRYINYGTSLWKQSRQSLQIFLEILLRHEILAAVW